MERIACIIDHIYIYWSSVILCLAAGSAVCTFLALYLRREKRAAGALVFVPMAAALALVLSRLIYWYFRPDSYGSLEEALCFRDPGGFALMGVFAGCILAAVLIRVIGLEKDLPELLDCLSPALALGIAAGRLASFFNDSGRGMVVSGQYGLPWAVSVINPVSGIPEHRLATFLLQTMAAGLIFVVLLVISLTGKHRRGDIFFLFLLLYGATQIVLDSTRYDSLYLRSNGFISAEQLLSAVAAAVVAIMWSVRMVCAGGWKKWHILLWLGQAGSFSIAGYMEYYVQRHGNEASFAYSVMGAALAVFVILTLATAAVAAAEKRRHDRWLSEIAAEKGGDSDGGNDCQRPGV